MAAENLIEIYGGGFKSGRTTSLVKRALRENLTLLVHTNSEKARLQSTNDKLLVLTYKEATYADNYGKLLNGYLIDNIEMFFAYVFKCGTDVKGFSIITE